MAKKRKSVDTRLDEADRSLYACFRSAANSLSQLYTQSMAQQKVAFQAGERHALENLCHWILRQHEEGSRVTTADIVAHIQNELHYGEEDVSMSPRMPVPSQHPQSTMHFPNSNMQTSSALPGQAVGGLAPPAGHSEQGKNSMFSNALSSPIRRSLQPYHLAQGAGYYANGVLPTGSGGRNHEMSCPNQNQDANSPSANDSSMDMHSDSPTRESF